VPVAALGPQLRRHPALGPEGANVSWVSFPNPSVLEIRTFERGVERETLACGSAVLAALVLGQELGRLGERVTARVAGGFPLLARRSQNGALCLAGDARLLARVELLEDLSLPLPTPLFVPEG
jgi:diaminopimelate epimerase